jgi:hypothetical protein
MGGNVIRVSNETDDLLNQLATFETSPGWWDGNYPRWSAFRCRWIETRAHRLVLAVAISLTSQWIAIDIQGHQVLIH